MPLYTVIYEMISWVFFAWLWSDGCGKVARCIYSYLLTFRTYPYMEDMKHERAHYPRDLLSSLKWVMNFVSTCIEFSWYQLTISILVSYGPMFIFESKVQVPVQSAVFTYGRQDTSDRSKVISRQESIFLGKRYNAIWMSQIARFMRPKSIIFIV